VTPYHYAGNNPISYNDPTGLLKALDFGKYYSGPSWSLHPGDGDWADTYSGAEGVAAGNPAEGDARAVKEGRMTLADYAAKWGESISPAQISITNEQGEPIIYNYHCSCWVNAKDVLAIDPAVQNADVRAWAQTAVNAFETSAQLQGAASPPSEMSQFFKFLDDFGDNVLNAGAVAWGSGELLYNTINARRLAYNLSKSTGFSAGRLFQAAKGTGKVMSRVGSTAAGIGIVLSVAVAGYEVYSHTDNTHTWVDLGMTAVGTGAIIIFGTAAAPAVLTAGVLYAGFVIMGGEDIIDKHFGYR